MLKIGSNPFKYIFAIVVSNEAICISVFIQIPLKFINDGKKRISAAVQSTTAVQKVAAMLATE